MTYIYLIFETFNVLFQSKYKASSANNLETST